MLLFAKWAGLQILSLALMIVGIPICAALSLANATRVVSSTRGTQKPHLIQTWPAIFWLWSNDEDGVHPQGYSSKWGAFVWTALRNPVDNFKYLGFAQNAPHLVKYFFGNFYAEWGWDDSGYIKCSAGRGTGTPV